MNLTLTRTDHTELSTIGDLCIDGHHECWTLEPVIPIPCGTYPVTLYHSPRFDRLLPLLHNVPGHEFIEIHIGNTVADTHGCILVGVNKSTNWIGNSGVAFAQLMYKISKPIKNEETVNIEIKEEQPSTPESIVV